MMRRSFQGTSWLWSWWRNEHLSFFVSTATCNTLWLQDTSGLIMGYYWSQVVGIHELTFLFNSEVFRITKCKSPKTNQPTFELLTPLSNNQHVPQKICIKNPAKSANLHRLRHGFGHSHDGSLCPRICRIKGAILRPSRPEGDPSWKCLVGFCW